MKKTFVGIIKNVRNIPSSNVSTSKAHSTSNGRKPNYNLS